MKRLGMVALLCVGLALPAVAGIEYEARTWQEGQQRNKQAEMTVRGQIDGAMARIEFVESGNPWMSQGTYLLTTDGGQTLQLVNPAEQTYGDFDLDAIMQLLGAFGESGLIDFEIDNPRIETLESGPGKTVAGLATRHVRYRTSYDMRIKVMGFKRAQSVRTVQDIWYTDELSDPAMGVWLRKEPPRTGTELDELIDLEVSKIQGFPLETVETMTTTGKKGKETSTTTHMLVSSLDLDASFPAGTFDIPAGYTPVQMMPGAEMLAAGQPPPEEQADGEGEASEEEKGGLMGRLKKFGKKKQ